MCYLQNKQLVRLHLPTSVHLALPSWITHEHYSNLDGHSCQPATSVMAPLMNLNICKRNSMPFPPSFSFSGRRVIYTTYSEPWKHLCFIPIYVWHSSLLTLSAMTLPQAARKIRPPCFLPCQHQRLLFATRMVSNLVITTYFSLLANSLSLGQPFSSSSMPGIRPPGGLAFIPLASLYFF